MTSPKMVSLPVKIKATNGFKGSSICFFGVDLAGFAGYDRRSSKIYEVEIGMCKFNCYRGWRGKIALILFISP
jgi:hypothetical protein